jgi:5'-nucleotidase
MRRIAALVAVLVAALAVVAPQAFAAKGPKDKKDNDTYVQLLAINDFHGHIQPNTPGTIRNSAGVAVPAGGAAYLATLVKSLRTTNANTITVGAGDLIGASPLASALFHDEPAIEVLNEIGLDVSGVGNHEFDEGVNELLRMQNGGCHPVDGCQDGDGFAGAIFQYLAANVFYAATHEPILPEYEIRKIDNAKIAFIGLTLEGTPEIVTPSGVAGLEFHDEVETVNALVHKLRNENGVRSFVVLLHEGGIQNAPFTNGSFADINGCDNLSGAIVPIANGLDPQVDVVVSAHTHQPYNCRIGGKLVTSASSFGRLVTDIDLVIDHQSKDIKSATALNRIVTQDVAPDPPVQAIVDKYVTLSAPLANRVVGTITQDIRSGRDTPSGTNLAGEQPMGDVIADGMLAATKPTDFGGAVAAFMNSGGVRAGLLFDQISGVEQPGEVTYGEAFTVQPFGNTLVVKTCSGQALYNVLEQQFNNPGAGQNRIMLVSANVHYQWNSTTTPRIVPGSLTIDGAGVNPAADYRVVMNNFMADGGDGYTVFRDQCTSPLGGEVDLDAFTRYLLANSPVAPPALDRIERVG